jgi:hypothetical protein
VAAKVFSINPRATEGLLRTCTSRICRIGDIDTSYSPIRAASKEEGSAKGVGASSLRERGPVYMPSGHYSVGGAGYTPSPNIPSGRQNTKEEHGNENSDQTNAAEVPGLRQEVDGLAMHKEHYVESGSVLARTVFDHVLDDCPYCGSYRVVERKRLAAQ